MKNEQKVKMLAIDFARKFIAYLRESGVKIEIDSTMRGGVKFSNLGKVRPGAIESLNKIDRSLLKRIHSILTEENKSEGNNL